ncbi:macrophage mannose receptor 1-like protein, partial [Leptotrombidium deliense]
EAIRSSKFKWVDESDFSYNNWYPAEPNEIQQNYINCINMFSNSGTWFDGNCDRKLAQALCVTSTRDWCPRNWTLFNKQCYYINDITLSVEFSEAQDKCKKLNATLVSIETQEQNDFIQHFINNRGTFLYSRNVWLNGQQREINSSSFKWLDGTKFKYTNWDMSQRRPQNYNADYLNCITMEKAFISNVDGFWFDAPCDSFYNAICVRPKFMTPATNSEITIHFRGLDRKVNMIVDKQKDLEEKQNKLFLKYKIGGDQNKTNTTKLRLIIEIN